MAYELDLSTAEKIETVVLSRKSGNLGKFCDMGFGRSFVTVDGALYGVSTDAHGWLVAPVGKRGFVAADADLYTAAKMAVEATQ